MALKMRGGNGGRKSLIFLGGSAAEVGGSGRKCISQVIDFLWRKWAEVGGKEIPHTPYARARAREGRARTRLLGVAP